MENRKLEIVFNLFEENQLYEHIVQLKMKANDGKMRKTDTKHIIKMINRVRKLI